MLFSTSKSCFKFSIPAFQCGLTCFKLTFWAFLRHQLLKFLGRDLRSEKLCLLALIISSGKLCWRILCIFLGVVNVHELFRWEDGWLVGHISILEALGAAVASSGAIVIGVWESRCAEYFIHWVGGLLNCSMQSYVFSLQRLVTSTSAENWLFLVNFCLSLLCWLCLLGFKALVCLMGFQCWHTLLIYVRASIHNQKETLASLRNALHARIVMQHLILKVDWTAWLHRAQASSHDRRRILDELMTGWEPHLLSSESWLLHLEVWGLQWSTVLQNQVIDWLATVLTIWLPASFFKILFGKCLLSISCVARLIKPVQRMLCSSFFLVFGFRSELWVYICLF